jgi:hypothetical protein
MPWQPFPKLGYLSAQGAISFHAFGAETNEPRKKISCLVRNLGPLSMYWSQRIRGHSRCKLASERDHGYAWESPAHDAKELKPRHVWHSKS